MMTFEEFKTKAEAELPGVLPKEYGNAEIRLQTVKKPGRTYTGMTVGAESGRPTAVVDLEMFYDLMEDESGFDRILKAMAEVAVMKPPTDCYGVVSDYGEAKEHLILRLINADRNRELLEQIPHKVIGDMALASYVMVPYYDGSAGCTAVSYDMMEEFGISEEELEKDASENSRELLPEWIGNLGAAAEGVCSEEGDSKAFLVSTNGMLNGAAAIFYPGVAERIAGMMGGDYYVLPSSVHEVITVPAEDEISVRALEEMVRSANEACVAPEDRLSNRVYRYCAEERILIPASEYPLPAFPGRPVS